MVSNIAFLTSVDLSHLDVCSFWRVVLEISARHDTSDRSSLSVKLLEMVDDQHDNVGPAPPKSLSQQPTSPYKKINLHDICKAAIVANNQIAVHASPAAVSIDVCHPSCRSAW